MANNISKKEGPNCACRRGDLYEEWLKTEENQQADAFDSTSTNQTDYNKSSACSAGKDYQKQEQRKN